jgi:uncharacterized protein YkwD
MRRIFVALVATAGGMAVAPAGAGAAEQCLYQGVPVSAGNQGAVERSLLCLTNVHRLRNGRGALLLDSRLSTAARFHSSDMVARGYFDHVTPEGLDPSDLAAQAGYPGGAAENIAANGSGSALSLFQQWLGSPGHNENMLTTGFRAAGMGVAPGFPGRSGGGTGTQMFGFGNADTGYAALDLYASNEPCAKGKLTRERIWARFPAKKDRTRKARRKLKRARALIRSNCQPPV